MSAAGFTPIQLYRSTTAAAEPTAGNLADGELAINTADGKLFYKNSGGAVRLLSIGYGSSTVTPTNGGVQYGTGSALALTAAGSSGQILRSNGAAAPTWENLSALGVSTISFGTTGLTPNSATSGAVTVAGTLATTNGGTGLTSFAANQVFYASSTSAVAQSSNLLYSGTDLTVYGVTVGRGAGAGALNTAVGASALANNSGNTANTALGTSALTNATSGIYNIGIGYFGGGGITTGSYNIGIGGQSLGAATTGDANISIGYQSMLLNTSGASNTSVGHSPLTNNTTGSNNTAIGRNALASNTTASNNTAVGYQAGYSNTTGAGLTALGYQALITNTTGGYNTAVGYVAGNSTTTGNNNVFVGRAAGYTNQTGGYNVFVGYYAGYTSNKASDGSGNVAIGTYAGYSLTTGDKNTFVGGNVTSGGAGYSITTGSANTIIGNYNGNQGGLDIRTASNYVVLSDGDGNPRWVINGSGTVTTSPRFNAASTLDASGATVTIRGNFPVTPLELQQDTTNNHYQVTFRNNLGTSPALVGSISSDGSYTNYNTGGNPLTAAQLNYQGITFPATQNPSSNANTLDDYEEGTFTPTVGGTWTTSPTGLAGTYVKIGRQVYVRIYFNGSASKSSATAGWIDSMPFTISVEGTGSGSDNAVNNVGNVLFANSTRMWLTANSFIAGANYFSGTYLTST